MKKLLLGACIIFGGIFAAKAQLPYMSNFTSTTLPVGWSAGVASHHPGNPGFRVNNNWPAVGIDDWKDYMPTDGWAAYVDDIDNNTGVVDNYDTLYSSAFSCAAASHVYMSFDLDFNNYTGSEVGTIAVSTNGGLTWTTAVTLPIYNGIISWNYGMVYDLTAFAAGKPSVMFAICWNNVGAVSQGYPGWGLAIANIDVFAPDNYDLSAVQASNFYLVKTGTAVTFKGTIFNWGGDSIVSMNVNYTVNGGPKQTDGIGLTLNRLSSYNFTHTINWTPSTPGNYLVRFWADSLNGHNIDQNNANDTLYAYYTVVDTLQPKQALFEEYMQASCNPCMYAGPNIEPVLNAAYTGGYCNSFRYHVDWPGLDYMNDEVQTPFVNTRVGYYGVDGVPDGKIDGTTDVSPSVVTTVDIQSAANLKSPMSITITSCTYTESTSTFNIQANIKSFAGVPEPTYARVVLSVDTIKYDSNQSDEDPTSSFPGTNPWSYYKYVKNFAQVAEDMLPSATGTALTSFATDQTQTINLSWKQSRPWGAGPKVNKTGDDQRYDSLFPGEHICVFVQEDQAAANTERSTSSTSYPTHSMTGAITQYVYQSASAPVRVLTGFEQLTNGVYFNMYPNPTTGQATIAFNIAQSQNVSVDVFNALGEKVYTVNEGKMDSGDHTISLNGQELKSGIYFVRFTTDNVTTTKKLVIQR